MQELNEDTSPLVAGGGKAFPVEQVVPESPVRKPFHPIQPIDP